MHRLFSMNGIFNFTTVNIPAGVTVTFQNNGTNTPVMILATGDVTIAGTIDIRGGSADTMKSTPGSFSQQGVLGGPGGYSGGRGGDPGGFPGASGQGPGGGEEGRVNVQPIRIIIPSMVAAAVLPAAAPQVFVRIITLPIR